MNGALPAALSFMGHDWRRWWSAFKQTGQKLQRPTPPSGLDPFRVSLAETITWCAEHATVSDPKTSLRSDELTPSPLSFLDSREGVVREVVRKRSWLVREHRPFHAQDLAAGRLLVYEPDMNLFDGAAEVNSRRFFDGNNIPPWDTWLGYVTDYWSKDPEQLERSASSSWCPQERHMYLLSWVPPQLVEPADLGIDANPEQCIRWADQAEHDFLRELRRAHFLS